MRNVFDQYRQPENRLTHALVCALDGDRRLLRPFVRWATGGISPKGTLRLESQCIPGEEEAAEEVQEQRGIPDGWVYSDGGWALLIESKAAAPVSVDQLRRHVSRAERRGFRDVRLLVLTARSRQGLERGHLHERTWSELYTWLMRYRRGSLWARRLMEYLEISETKLAAEEYLTEGALTVFSGIPFDADSPYTYLEAKRLLRLALDELRTRKDLIRGAGLDPNGMGRGAITGTKGSSVWDFLRVGTPKKVREFTKAPHLTLSIQQERVLAMVTVPNGVTRQWRRQLVKLDDAAFRDLFATINRRLARALRTAPGAIPWVEVVQRHSRSQRGKPIVDARLEFDLSTAFGGRDGVKEQAQWLSTTHEVLRRKKGNVQLMVGASFRYDQCRHVQKRLVLDAIAATWIACRPLVDTMFASPRLRTGG